MKGGPQVRHPGQMHVDVHREWIRTYMPRGSEHSQQFGRWGFCYDDIDGLFRTYQTVKDPCGPLTVIEVKKKGNSITPSQGVALSRLDAVMRLGDAQFGREHGFTHSVWNGVYQVEYLDLEPAPECEACKGTGYRDGATPQPGRDSVRWWVNGDERDADGFRRFLLSPPKHAEPKWRAA